MKKPVDEVMRTTQEIMSGFARTMNERFHALEEASKAEAPRCTCLGLTFSNTGHSAQCRVTAEAAHG